MRPKRLTYICVNWVCWSAAALLTKAAEMFDRASLAAWKWSRR